MRPCYQFIAAAADDQPATLSIYDEIGFWGVQAKDFIADLGKVSAKVLNVEINSPGGDVFAGLAIYNALKQSGKEIVVKVMGVAASAASLIAMAGDKIVMPKNTFMMVHNPWSFAMGNADELRETADTLDKIGASLQATYVARTGQTPEKVAELLAKDTWLTADEAKELGFATEVVDDVKANAVFDMERADLPENVRAVFKAAVKPTAEDPPKVEDPPKADPDDTTDPADDDNVVEQVTALAKAAGLSDDHLGTVVLAVTTVEDGKARVAHARTVCALCKAAGLPDKAGAAIRANTPLPDLRAALVKARAEADEHTDNTRKTPAGKTVGGFSATQAYAKLEEQKQSRKAVKKGQAK